jgi:hypothetical protein
MPLMTARALITEGETVIASIQEAVSASTTPRNYLQHNHHIVAQNDPRAATARSILNQVFPLDRVNHWSNIVSLPASTHWHVHTDAYHQWVENLVVAASNLPGNRALNMIITLQGIGFMLRTITF